MVWKPRVVVASVIEQDNRYLMVEEAIRGHMLLNQPAGHLEYGESLLDAARRETLEETGYHYEPEAFLGASLGESDDPERVYLRFSFVGHIASKAENYQIDPDITAVHWLTEDEIRNSPNMTPRNDLVLKSIELYKQGIRLPLDSLHYMKLELL
uniref:Phosphatase NudJ n=1 Tax=uncultured Thiotrichaceae bacterium TaxID=298394 RepID=A0A6S6TMT6_9GAMM|nr:MAG: Phosphatase NudJ [uncultured Thiotrichaceae bacterium]